MQANYIDHMGTDLRVVEAAKISFANEAWFIGEDYMPNKDSRHFKDWCQYLGANPEPYISVEDYGLIHYLAEHNHWTPFAHPQITLRMRAPVPIRTQCFKHKQGFVENEESRRYIDCEPTFYIPEEFRGKPTDGAKQGSSGVITGDAERKLIWLFEAVYEHAYLGYKGALARGLCPEQARFLLPQGTEVNWYWTGSLAAFARFAKQRMDSHAQGEIQELAHEVSEILEPLYPVSWPLLIK